MIRKANNIKKLLSVLVVFSMVATAAMTISVGAAEPPPEEEIIAPRVAFEMNASGDKDMYFDTEEGMVRVYGEKDAIYPTQSYRGATDFIYPNYVDPFDPGVIAKDSVTFNAAFIDLEYYEPYISTYGTYYPYSGEQTPHSINWTTDTIRVNGGDASEKVFLRMFYEPNYTHPVDSLMDEYSNVDLHPVGGGEETFDALVVETTYMLTKRNRDPLAGYPPGQDTHFVLPYTVFPEFWARPGMSMGGIVDLNVASSRGTSQLTDGAIEVQRTFQDIPVGTRLNFMDHNITITSISGGFGETNKIRVDLTYAGNMMKAHSALQTHLGITEGTKLYVNRANKVQETTNPAYRWYFSVDYIYTDPMNPSLNKVDITLGRHLAAGETFYVNGVRYDMPAIYVTDQGAFKYITLQTPLPKCEYGEPVWKSSVTENWEDWSHVTSQWLANVPRHYINNGNGDDEWKYIWFLPPFIDGHKYWAGEPGKWTMVDDIGLLKNNTLWDEEGVDIEIPERGILIEQKMESLEGLVYWTEQCDYEPFNTSLAERLYVDEVQEWDWWNVYTKPIHYTLIHFPDLEEKGMNYVESDIKYAWYADYLESIYGEGNFTVDGAEYLLTTSFIAPNSEEDQRHNQSKTHWEAHDIVDRAKTIANAGDTSRDAYYWQPRVVFEINCKNQDPIYIDESEGGNRNGGNYTLARIFGEKDAIYPTQSYRGATDFIYPNYVDPFDPGVIAKDSVTFNAAFIDLEYYEPYISTYGTYYPYSGEQTPHSINWTTDTIRVNGGDASEKVFLRMFYEPNYTHPVDSLMDEYSNVDLHPVGGGEETFDALVVETTYMLTKRNRDPLAGYPPGQDTHFVLPYTVFPEFWARPGMSMGGIVDLNVASSRGTSQLTDGAIEVQRTFQDIPVGTRLNFMDHNITITSISGGFGETNKIRVDLTYAGNMMKAHSALQTHLGITEGTKLYVNRANKVQETTNPAYRWYFSVDYIYTDPMNPSLNKVDITLGRHLAAGETFYVNGVRYDMPAIYVTDQGAFKYITLQTPLPKCEYGEPVWKSSVTENWEDWSHVTSQWLANVPRHYINNGNGDDEWKYIWFLPPFIDGHKYWAGEPGKWTMVDDIGLLKNNTLWDEEGVDIEIPERGILIEQKMESLEGLVYWTEQCDYEPFNTSLAERLYVDEVQEWDWWNVYTKPIHYTLIHFPDLEEKGMNYVESDIKYAWYADYLESIYGEGNFTVDGAEYLLTTSWLAPNSEDEERHRQSKTHWEVHDIIGTGLVPFEPPMEDWNPWDDDGVITTNELQEIINHWVNDIPKNDHLITTSELQEMINLWLTS